MDRPVPRLEAEDLAADPAFVNTAARTRNAARVNAELGAVLRRFTTTELVERLNAAGVPCGPIYDIGAAFEDPQARHLRMTRPARHHSLGEIQLVRSPINLSRFPHPERFDRPAPDPGEHTEALLQELGHDQASIDELRRERAIA